MVSGDIDKSCGLISVHAEGDLVEYFSSVRKVWLVGVVHISAPDAKKGSSRSPALVYNVSLEESQQTRNEVPLDMIRAPFQPAELVEVFTKRNSGQWMLASIIGPVTRDSIYKGYTVRVEAQQSSPAIVFQRVSSSRLRRRFPPCSSIDVYRGPLLGWERCVVHSSVLASPPKPPTPLSSSSPAAAKDQPWVLIPVYIEEWDDDERNLEPEKDVVHLVPSYLARLQMMRRVSSRDCERRSFAV